MTGLARDRYAAAVSFAIAVHGEQRRKGTGAPYLSHLLAVTALVLEYGGDEDQAITAILHDTAEDAAAEVGGDEILRRIEAAFGARVAAMVRDLSDTLVKPKPPWRERKEAYLVHLAGTAPDVALVSAADKVHNASSILREVRREGDAVWSRFHAGRDEQLWYFHSLVDVLDARLPGHPLVARLDAVVDELTAAATA